MVTHELLGTIKGANAELDMLKAALVDMTAQRDARMDMTTLAGMGAGGGMSAANAEEYQTLKVKGEESTETYLYGGRRCSSLPSVSFESFLRTGGRM